MTKSSTKCEWGRASEYPYCVAAMTSRTKAPWWVRMFQHQQGASVDGVREETVLGDQVEWKGGECGRG